MRRLNADVVANMHKDLVVTQRDKGELAKIRMSREVLESMQL